MKGMGVIVMLGLVLACVLVFAYWLRTPHRLGLRWNAVDRGLEQFDLIGDQATR